MMKRVAAMSELDGWLKIKRDAMVLDAQVKIAYHYRRFVKLKKVREI